MGFIVKLDKLNKGFRMKRESIKLDDIIKIKVIGRDEDKKIFGLKATIYNQNINIIEKCFNNKEFVSLNRLNFIIESYTFKSLYEELSIIEIILKEI